MGERRTARSRPTTTPVVQPTTRMTARTARLDDESAAPPIAASTSEAGIAAARVMAVATTATDASRGTRTRRASTASCATRVTGAAAGSQVAANRPQPDSSPTAQPMPSAIGAQPTTARATRPANEPLPASSQRSTSRRAARRSVGRRERSGALVAAADPAAGRARRTLRRDRPGRRRPTTDGPRRRAAPAVAVPRGGGPAPRVGRVPPTSPSCASAGRPPGPRLVLRAVLARVGVLLRVERPVRPGRRAVPARRRPSRARTARARRRRTRSSRGSPSSGRSGRSVRRRGGGSPAGPPARLARPSRAAATRASRPRRRRGSSGVRRDRPP